MIVGGFDDLDNSIINTSSLSTSENGSSSYAVNPNKNNNFLTKKR